MVPFFPFFCTQRYPGPLLGSVFLAQELEQDTVRETWELLAKTKLLEENRRLTQAF